MGQQLRRRLGWHDDIPVGFAEILTAGIGTSGSTVVVQIDQPAGYCVIPDCCQYEPTQRDQGTDGVSRHLD